MSNILMCMEEEVTNVCASSEEDADGFIRMNDELSFSSISTIGDERNSQDDKSLLLSSSSYLPESFLSWIDSRWSDNNSFGLKKKIHDWCQLPNGEWMLGRILSTSGAGSITYLLEGKVIIRCFG
ncbi:hypothetical protein KFK09_009456 [Dendrobium nobile]|uniref:Myosin-1-3 N-terminal SH3 domain-containing protein n=1 Tax=Dendrobium nobile TaxID=94219 RepID=A0A8T3BJZ9_DENNO|nr:hypothetical protein KFK09_009456 [Dendrobium nobile]